MVTENEKTEQLIKTAMETEAEKSSKAIEHALQEERSRSQKLLEEQRVCVHALVLKPKAHIFVGKYD